METKIKCNDGNVYAPQSIVDNIPYFEAMMGDYIWDDSKIILELVFKVEYGMPFQIMSGFKNPIEVLTQIHFLGINPSFENYCDLVFGDELSQTKILKYFWLILEQTCGIVREHILIGYMNYYAIFRRWSDLHSGDRYTNETVYTPDINKEIEQKLQLEIEAYAGGNISRRAVIVKVNGVSLEYSREDDAFSRKLAPYNVDDFSLSHTLVPIICRTFDKLYI